jgi:formate--tetrahydrofolate ligase
MSSDLEIARSVTARPIAEIAAGLSLAESDWRPCDRAIAKIDPALLRRARTRPRPARLVLVSAITPTPAGEGKTTTSIGLADGLARLGESVCLALREPSLGPSFGMKGGATGGGRAQLLPMEKINLHFTGDFHAVTAAHNLLAALLDNHIHFGNGFRIDPRRILWRRVQDVNDRALRNVVVGLGGHRQGVPRETGFDITAASEVMAMLCLAEDEEDLRARIDRLLVAFTYDGEPVTARGLRGAGAMLALLRDALWPNLVQTLEGTPAIVHGGPFGNIAHGCNSVVATRTALQLADWVVTEAGFGFDLGAEKFFDIKCRSAGLDPAVVVLVATVRALKLHGGAALGDLASPDAAAVARGLPNLEKHIENVCAELGVPFAVTDHHAKGGAGAEDLAREVRRQADSSPPFRALYELSDPVEEKVLAVARTIYGARGVDYTREARRDLRDVRRLGYEQLPVCIAKTQASLSDDPKLTGRPADFEVTVRGVQINAGAGFLVVLTGDILRMPGLPRRPRAEAIDLRDGEIVGLE